MPQKSQEPCFQFFSLNSKVSSMMFILQVEAEKAAVPEAQSLAQACSVLMWFDQRFNSMCIHNQIQYSIICTYISTYFFIYTHNSCYSGGLRHTRRCDRERVDTKEIQCNVLFFIG